jgi:hypothetical protein
MFSTGYVRDLPDVRDRVFERLPVLGATEPPAEHHELATMFDILLEQKAESCVGFSLSEALYAGWRASGIETPFLASPLFIWWCSRHTHGSEFNNAGTYIRTALKQMRELGFCPDVTYPGTGGADLRGYNQRPSRLAFQKAIDQRLSDLEYYRVTGLGDERVLSWKRAISSGHPVVVGVPIERAFFKWDGVGYIKSPMLDSQLVDGHAMCALGYTEQGVYGPQTWGRSWGQRGWFRLSWQYILDWALDQWAIKTPQYFSEAA